jgi:sugar lactone lactonase YvrE
MRRAIALVVLASCATLSIAMPTGNIDTVAGRGFEEGVLATETTFSAPRGVAVDSAGNIYVADTGNALIRKITSDGVIHTVWRGSTVPVLSNFPIYYQGPADCPGDMAADAGGNVYFANPCQSVVIKIDAAGNATVAAGKRPSTPIDPTGDGGPATDASLYFPSSIAVDAAGTLFINETSITRIRKVSGGIITTVPGSTVLGTSGGPTGFGAYIATGPLAADGAGGVYAYMPEPAFFNNGYPHPPFNRLIHVDAAGVLTTLAGDGTTTNSGDGGAAAAAGLGAVQGIAVSSGDVLLTFSDRVRRISGGTIDTVATPGGGDIAVDGATFVLTNADIVERLTLPSSRATIAGGATPGAYVGDGGDATLAGLYKPTSVVVDATGVLYIADTGHDRVRKVDAAGIINTYAGNGTSGYSGDGGNAVDAQLAGPTGLALDVAGNLYISDRGNNRVRKVDAAGVITTVAGTGVAGSAGDGGPAIAAQLSMPSGLVFTAAGDLLVADYDNERIRRITPGGTISTVAGGGTSRYYSRVPPFAATDLFMEPSALAMSSNGSLFVVNDDVASPPPSTALFVLGFDAAWTPSLAVPASLFIYGFGGASYSQRYIGKLAGIAVGDNGNLYLSDSGHHQILKQAPGAQGGIVVAGSSPCINQTLPCPGGFSGDGSAALLATLNAPTGLYWDAPSGLLYVADTGNGRVRTMAFADPLPFPFSIAGQTGVAPATPIVAAPVTPVGFRLPTPISVSGGDYSIGCTGTFTAAAGTIAPGQSVCVRQTSSVVNNAATTAVLTIGGQAASFVVRTQFGPGSASLSGSALDFGGQSIDTSDGAQAIVVTNTGTNAVTLNEVEAPAGFGVTHDCATVAAGATCTLSILFTPGSEGTLGGTLLLHFSFGDASISLAGVGEKSLATHYYRSILRRDPDATGKAFWEGEATRAANLGANPNEAWYAMAATFFGSPEYLAFNRSDDDFLTDVYKTFFNRDPDSAGLAYWKGQLSSGITRDMVIASFTFSTEFTNFTQAIFGHTQVRAENDMVTDMYRGFLQRLPDDTGFQFWVGKLRAAQCLTNGQGQQAAAVRQAVIDLTNEFLASPEYTNRNRTDPQFLADVYNAIQRRGGDTSGMAFWLGWLATSGNTRAGMLSNTVLYSPEFQARVYNVVYQGCLH